MIQARKKGGWKSPAYLNKNKSRPELEKNRTTYCNVGRAIHAPSLLMTDPSVLKWITPGSSLQKLRVPVRFGTIGVAVTKYALKPGVVQPPAPGTGVDPA